MDPSTGAILSNPYYKMKPLIDPRVSNLGANFPSQDGINVLHLQQLPKILKNFGDPPLFWISLFFFPTLKQ